MNKLTVPIPPELGWLQKLTGLCVCRLGATRSILQGFLDVPRWHAAPVPYITEGLCHVVWWLGRESELLV
jgi:hypothetical protein